MAPAISSASLEASRRTERPESRSVMVIAPSSARRLARSAIHSANAFSESGRTRGRSTVTKICQDPSIRGRRSKTVAGWPSTRTLLGPVWRSLVGELGKTQMVLDALPNSVREARGVDSVTWATAALARANAKRAVTDRKTSVRRLPDRKTTERAVVRRLGMRIVGESLVGASLLERYR